MKQLILACALACALALTGCTDAERSQWSTYGHSFRVTVWGQQGPVHTWTSSGKVFSEHESDGWTFRDDATGGLVHVSGTVSVEEIVPGGTASPAPEAP